MAQEFKLNSMMITQFILSGPPNPLSRLSAKITQAARNLGLNFIVTSVSMPKSSLVFSLVFSNLGQSKKSGTFFQLMTYKKLCKILSILA